MKGGHEGRKEGWEGRREGHAGRKEGCEGRKGMKEEAGSGLGGSVGSEGREEEGRK